MSGSPASIDGGTGTDTIRVSGNASFTAGSVTNVERVRVENGASTSLAALTSGFSIYSSRVAGGSVTVQGSSGNDMFYDGAGADRFVGNAGIDTFTYQNAAAGVTANLGDSSVNTASATGDTYAGVENLTGSRHDDILHGDRFANVIDGGNGNDTIYGGKGDTLIGGRGNDTFILDGATSGTPISIDGTASTNIRNLDTNTIDVVGDTTYSTRSTIANIQNIDVADGVSLDLSLAKLEPSDNGTQYITSLSVAGSGSTIMESTVSPNVPEYFFGGDGADTLIGGKYNNEFSVKATPTLVDGSTPGGYVDLLAADITIDNNNFENIYGFTGNNFDLSNYNYSGKFFSMQAVGDNAEATGTSGNDIIYNYSENGLITGGAGVDTISLFQTGTALFHTGDTGITATTLDEIRDFQSGSDKIEIDGISSSSSTYAEASIASGSFDDAKAAATSLMADGTKVVVFIAGGANHDGYLFWNANETHNAPYQAIDLAGGSTLGFFDSSDVAASSGSAAHVSPKSVGGNAAFTQALFDGYLGAASTDARLAVSHGGAGQTMIATEGGLPFKHPEHA